MAEMKFFAIVIFGEGIKHIKQSKTQMRFKDFVQEALRPAF